MMKLLIVDDEQVVREGLQAILHKGFPELIIEQAKNGKAAVELTPQFRPDLILMDIKMPGMDGLETVEQIGEQFPDVKFVMVTAYDTFDYARRALKLGVKDYLLKPSKASEITSTISRVFSEIEQERQNREYSQRREDTLQKLMPIIESDMVTQLLFDHIHAVHLDEIVQWLGIEADSEKYAMAVIVPPARTDLYSVIKDCITKSQSGLVGPLNGRQIPIVMFRRPGQSFRAQAAAVARELIELTSIKGNDSCFVGIGNVYRSLSEVRQSYQEALIATTNTQVPVKFRFYMDQILSSTSGPIKQEEQQSKSAEKRLIEQVRLGDWDTIREETIGLLQSYKNEGIHHLQAQQHMLQRLWIASRMLTEMGIEISSPVYSVQSEDYRQLQQETSWIMEKMKSSFDAYLQQIKPDTIRQIKQYISDQSHREISLEMIGETFNLSPFYISKLFKEQMGINYIDYLTECRIEKAKKMMSDPARSLKEITFEVGYRDPNYFSKVFKKMCHVSPTEYRKALLGGRE